MNPLQPAFLGAVLAPGLARYGGALAGPAKAQVLCLPVAFLCLETPLFPAVWELVPSLFVSSPALGPFLWVMLTLCLGGFVTFGLAFLAGLVFVFFGGGERSMVYWKVWLSP